MKRPFGVTVLAILAGLAGAYNALRVLQFLGILPFFGTFQLHNANWWYAFMYAILVWIYIWLVKMLWEVQYQAWLFLAVITVFDLIMYFIELVTSGVTSGMVAFPLLVNGLILIYIMLPGVRQTFEASKPQV